MVAFVERKSSAAGTAEKIASRILVRLREQSAKFLLTLRSQGSRENEAAKGARRVFAQPSAG